MSEVKKISENTQEGSAPILGARKEGSAGIPPAR